MKNKIFNKYTSWIAGTLIGASLFYGANHLDNKIVNEESIYSIVPEVRRVLNLEEKISDFKDCAQIVENSQKLSKEFKGYLQEYQGLMEKQEVTDARLQITKNKSLERNSFLMGMAGFYSLVSGFLIPYIIRKKREGEN